MNENVVVKTKNNKGLILLVIILIISVIGLAGYIVYDKVISKESDNKEEVTKVEEKEEIKDITNTELAKGLHSTLITKDKASGLYFENKVTSLEVSNADLIVFNIKNYLTDNNINLGESEQIKCAGDGFETIDECGSHKINKSDITTYMQNKYNNNIKYELSKDLNKFYELYGTYVVVSNDETYEIMADSSASGFFFIKSKLVKAEQDDEYVYIYDKAVFCTAGAGSFYFYNMMHDGLYSSTEEDSLLSIEEKAEDILNNLSDKLDTFKHTFKKDSDGIYYWVSSEMLK